MVDELTAAYYTTFANDIATRHDPARTEKTRSLRRAFSEGMRVLDIGAGSGRHLDILLQMGCDAYGVEPCDELRVVAMQRYPQLAKRLARGELPDLDQPFGGDFDGVLCSAVLMHVPRAEMLSAAIALRNVLRDNGKLLLSIPLERPGLDSNNRDEHGRLFASLPPDYLQLFFERIGFQLVERWESKDYLDRKGHSWCTFLFHAQYRGGARPLDQIEGILNRDRKTATYKLALFRALSEIATTEFEQARWVEPGVVGIPVAIVCEKWLHYYWPLFQSTEFIPQIRGESMTCRMPVSFRSSLSELVRRYDQLGQLGQFLLDYRRGRLSEDNRRLFDTVIARIRNTIVKGPVTFSGGSLGSGRVFHFDVHAQQIRMSASIWRELSLVGHWIQDAVILRWAELTSEISGKGIRPSQVIELLLAVPTSEREVAEARRTYEHLATVECTWSGVPLRRDFEVDHIIPFSLWHNNDLWNLVPASRVANAHKSDKLPTLELMLRRRDRIVNYWETLRHAHQTRFDHEVRRIAGVTSLPNEWQTLAFQCVCDAVEFTGAQRGCERWQP